MAATRNGCTVLSSGGAKLISLSASLWGGVQRGSVGRPPPTHMSVGVGVGAHAKERTWRFLRPTPPFNGCSPPTHRPLGRGLTLSERNSE
eukprot:5126720-Prymnesium_polylepis.1